MNWDARASFLRVRPAFEESDSTLSPVGGEDASHAEVSLVGILSVMVSLAPFPEMNQDPRNMFQCQLAKETMGTPCHRGVKPNRLEGV